MRDPVGELDTAHAWHALIRDDEVVRARIALEHGKRFVAAVSYVDLEAPRSEQFAHELGDRFLIVYDEDPSVQRRRPRTPRRAVRRGWLVRPQVLCAGGQQYPERRAPALWRL